MPTHTTPSHPSRTNRRSAFTLLELLVVIAIIGSLVAILIPSLNKARDSAKDTQCLNRLRSLFLAHMTYLQDYDRFPTMNNDEDDGAWQYNYLIFDGRDFSQNFGPLLNDGRTLNDIEILTCPVQRDPFHIPGSRENPWPVVPGLDTRAAYGRRYHLSGKTLSQLPHTIGFATDIFHLPSVIKTGHKDGVNAIYTDGHGQWVVDPGNFAKNDLASPFDVMDNGVIEDFWDIVDEAK